MIKLFWNTHNQNKPSSKESNTQEARDYIWGTYHKNNSNKWIYEILNKVKYQSIENENALESGDILIVVDSSIEKKNDLYSKLKLICSKLFLIYLGDEGGVHDLSEIYKKFNFVWRGFLF